MVQRLSQLGKDYEKDRKVKKIAHVEKVKKRVAKESEKRDAKSKEMRKGRYMKEQGKATRKAKKGGVNDD